uniref:Uncharacterized protein n=1 Tax=Acrobeloides nanus TaxID=290746 RepID=A0A914E455_9BILA
MEQVIVSIPHYGRYLHNALHSFHLTSNATSSTGSGHGSTARTAAATSPTLDRDEEISSLFRSFSSATNLEEPEPNSSGRIVTSALTNEGMEKTFDNKIHKLKLSISNLLSEKILDFRHLKLDANREILDQYTSLAYTLYETGKYANIPVYRHFSSPKGLAIIINELTYPPPKGKTDPEKREGSKKDAQNLEELFKAMNFEIYNGSTFVDLKKQDMLECLEIFAKDELHNNYHSCIVVIMGHGNNGIIWDIEGKPIDIQHILNLFNGENAPGLVGKPKLFISQACRGGNSDYGVPYNDQQEDLSRPDPSSSVEDQFEDVVNEPSKKKLKQSPAPGSKKISISADFFELYPTVPTMPASRGKQGSMFIDTICKVFYEFAHLNDLEEMAMMIKRLVSRRHYTITDKLTQERKIKYQQPQLSTTNGARYFMFPCVYI